MEDSSVSELIIKDLAAKLDDIPDNLKEVTANLWSRWFTSTGMRLGLTPDQLYRSVEVDISNSSSIVKQFGRFLGIPDALKENPTLLSLLNNKELLEYLDSKVGIQPEQPQQNFLSEWMQDSKLTTSEGEPLVFYHGSFGDLSSFNKSEQGLYSRLGKGFYFSSNSQDASDNYASPESPELQAKAQAIMNSLLQSGTPISDIDYSQIKKSLAEEGGAVYPVYLRVNKPFIIDESIPFHRGVHDKAIPFGAIATSIISDHEGTMDDVKRLEKKLNGAANTIDAINVITEFGRYNSFDGLAVQIIEKSGYDGIIDRSAGQLWHTPDNTEHVIVFEPNQIKSAIGNVGSYNDSSHNILYQDAPSYESVLFQFGGPKAVRANTTMLHAAQRLDKKGEDMERIRQVTGWHRWIDDKWRFEIDDSQAMLHRTSFQETTDHFDRQASHRVGPSASFANIPPKEQEYIRSNYSPSLTFNGALEDVLEHTRIFAYYPQLRDIKVDIQIHPDLQKTTAQITAGMPPDCTLTVREANGKKATEAILHELQHGIQTIESFASGGSSSNYHNQPTETRTFYERQLKDLQAVFDIADTRDLSLPEAAEKLGSLISSTTALLAKTNSSTQLKDYAHQLECQLRPPRTRYLFLGGEYEARQVVNRQFLSSAERMKTPIDAFEPVDQQKLEVIFTDNGSNDSDFQFSEHGPLGAVIRNPLEQRFLMLLSDDYDPSTLLHESSHIFLDIFRFQALKDDAPKCIKEDFKKICKFVGAKPDQELTREQNEKWAIACETYFLKLDHSGSSIPPAFERMNSLMESTYGEAADLGVELSPEMKGVLDRMFDKQDEHIQIDFSEISDLINSQFPNSSPNQVIH